MTTKKKFFNLTSITEYKTLEKYFEKMASEGWMLKEIVRYRFIFEKTEPKQLTFNVSLFYPKVQLRYAYDNLIKEYRELCEDSGWIYCAGSTPYQIFYKTKGAEAVDVHTDSYEEYRIVLSIFLRTEFVSMIARLYIIIIGLKSAFDFNYEDMLTNSRMLYLLTPIVVLIIFFAIDLPLVIGFVKNRINLAID